MIPQTFREVEIGFFLIKVVLYIKSVEYIGVYNILPDRPLIFTNLPLRTDTIRFVLITWAPEDHIGKWKQDW